MNNRISELGFGRYLSQLFITMKLNSSIRMSLLKLLKIIFNPKVYIYSKLYKKKYSSLSKAYVSPDKKSFEFASNQLKGIEALIKHCLIIYNKKKEKIKNNYIPPTFKVIGSINHNGITRAQTKELKPILKFASQPILMNLISNYVGQVPVIFSATLTYTKPMPKNYDPINFQKFHVDMLDKSLLHLVIPIKNISDKNGPFTYVDAPTSKKIMSNLNYQGGRIEDEYIHKYAKKSNIIKLCGSPGKAWLVSPYYCLHMGARVERGSRLMLIICYGSPNMAIEHSDRMHRKDIQEAFINQETSLAEKHLLRIYN